MSICHKNVSLQQWTWTLLKSDTLNRVSLHSHQQPRRFSPLFQNRNVRALPKTKQLLSPYVVLGDVHQAFSPKASAAKSLLCIKAAMPEELVSSAVGRWNSGEWKTHHSSLDQYFCLTLREYVFYISFPAHFSSCTSRSFNSSSSALAAAAKETKTHEDCCHF